MIQRNNIIAHKAIRPLSAKGWIFQLRKRWPSPSKCFFRKFSIIGVESWQKIFSDVETAICRWENEHQTAFCLRKMKILLTLSLNHSLFAALKAFRTIQSEVNLHSKIWQFNHLYPKIDISAGSFRIMDFH